MEVFKKSKYAILMDKRLFEEDFLDRMAIPQVFIYRQVKKISWKSAYKYRGTL